MNTRRFDRLTEAFTRLHDRRDLLRVVGLAIVGASAPVLSDTRGGDAKKRGQQKTCRAGKKVATISVPATGTVVLSPVLLKGQRYRLVASGFWATNAIFGNDAAAAFAFSDPTKFEETFEGVRLGLSLDGGSPDQWGPYNAGHIYERRFSGRGGRLSFRFTDPAVSDNSGSVSVKVFCA